MTRKLNPDKSDEVVHEHIQLEDNLVSETDKKNKKEVSQFKKEDNEELDVRK